MFNKHSITGRIIVSGVTGLIIGSFALLTLLPLIPIETSLEFKIGLLLLMVTMGVMIGFTGMFERNPLFPSIAMPWWLRGPSIGILFFLILVMLAKDQMILFMSLDIVAWTGFTSPYWILLEGVFWGGFIGYITTKICGEGSLPSK